MRLRILTRSSDLARLQGLLVKQRIEAARSRVEITLLTREAAGDRDAGTPLWQLGDKGAFTSDLSDALSRGDADVVVHSWKDLPIEPRRETTVAATLPRADARDVLLLGPAALARRPARLAILTSAPRRALMLGESLPALLPWPVEQVECVPVRGNVQTRVRQLIDGAGDGLIVAKAALDRLLDPASPYTETARRIRDALDACGWMVLPLREFPSAAAQGALALEAAAGNAPVLELLAGVNHAATWRAVTAERNLLAAYGGGCHQAIGVSVQPMPFGDVVSVRGRTDQGEPLSQWSLLARTGRQPKAPIAAIWPRPGERDLAVRTPLPVRDPQDGRGLYVTRDDALPRGWSVDARRLVWAAGHETWRKLAARGVWVHGSSEGLGQFDPSVADRLAGRAVRWHRLTHAGAAMPDALATYEADSPLPADLECRTHFFWRSGSEFRAAIARCPQVRDRWHACGPGHTFDVVERIAGSTRVRPFLGYAEWLAEVGE